MAILEKGCKKSFSKNSNFWINSELKKNPRVETAYGFTLYTGL